MVKVMKFGSFLHIKQNLQNSKVLSKVRFRKGSSDVILFSLAISLFRLVSPLNGPRSSILLSS